MRTSPTATMDATFQNNVIRFIAHVQRVIDDSYKNNGIPMCAKTITLDTPGRRYLRVVRKEGDGQRSVYCFVDKATGDILKPDTWAKPARHARGNIADEATYTCAGPYGIAYLR